MGCVNNQGVIPTPPLQKFIQQKQIHPSVSQNPHQLNQITSKPNLAQLQRMGDQYFKEGNYLQAIRLNKQIIESGYAVDFLIEGLGNFDLSTYHYEWWTYKWYNEECQAGRIKGNVFDALSLCYHQIRQSDSQELEKGILWYEDMLCKKVTYELYMGYANILYNKSLYDAASKAYNKVIAMRPQLINSYACLMFMYQYRRVEKSKATALANIILFKDPDNLYAIFVFGRNEKDTDERIRKLKEGAQKYPKYIRIVNEVGISYGAKKDHKSAIEWYKKCVLMAPDHYSQGYSNIAYRTQMLQDYEQAVNYYYKAMQVDAKYKLSYKNAIKCFDKLKYTDEDIIRKMKEYPKMDQLNFYYYIGLAHYDSNNKDKTTLVWYKRALQIDQNSQEVYNSMGRIYDNIKDYENGQKCFLKAIQLNPKYSPPYCNMGLLKKHEGKIDLAIQWYTKSILNHPNYYRSYNNLGRIYHNKKQYKKAIQLYKKCIEIHSTYTLAFCNMAISYLRQEMFQDAFAAFARAKQLLPTDNSDLSQSNKEFLKKNIAQFDIQGEKWRKTGSIGTEQRSKLQSLIRSFESNFEKLYSNDDSAFQQSEQIVLKPSMLKIVSLIYEDQFQLKNIEQIFVLVKQIFHEDEQYFHIIPQLFIQYFWKCTFDKNLPILQVQSQLFNIIKNLSIKEARQFENSQQNISFNYQLKHFNPPQNFKVNLFKETTYFSSYEVLYNEIDKLNAKAEIQLNEFAEFVDSVKKRSNGILYGVNMKMPKKSEQQFKVILRILQKMFKKQLKEERVKSIITKIDKSLREDRKKVTLTNIVHEIIYAWTNEITLILQQRKNNKIETACAISDLLRGKLMFNSVQDVEKAVQACDKLCYLKGYTVLQLDNRLSKPQTKDVVLKIQVNEAVCELQLALKQEQYKYHFIHSIYQIERSPLGCIFGSYLFMSKAFHYPFLANCIDIKKRLQSIQKPQNGKIIEATKYIIQALEQS